MIEGVVVSREGGRSEEVGFERIVDVDFVRVCARDGIVDVEEEDEESVLDVDALRICLYCVNGGRERSCLTGSAVVIAGTVLEDALGRRVEVDLCSEDILEV